MLAFSLDWIDAFWLMAYWLQSSYAGEFCSEPV
jgi:hypothetical protein